MKKLLTLLFLLLPLGVLAQKFPANPETGRITYSEVVSAEGRSQADLYIIARSWVAKAFKSANHVIQMDTPEMIVVKGITPYYTKSIGQTVASDLHFTATIEIKEGRYKYTVTDFSSDGKSQIENDLLNPKVIYKKDGTVRDFYAGSVAGLEKAMQDITQQIKNAMATSPKSSDW